MTEPRDDHYDAWNVNYDQPGMTYDGLPVHFEGLRLKGEPIFEKTALDPQNPMSSK